MDARFVGESILRDGLIVSPRWAVRVIFAILITTIAGALLALFYPFTPALATELKAVAGNMLAISLPGLALAIAVFTASRGTTRRIDELVHQFLRETVLAKFAGYIDLDRHRAEAVLMSVKILPKVSGESYCVYRFTTTGQRAFDVSVKMNVFNFEVYLNVNVGRRHAAAVRRLAQRPLMIECSDDLDGQLNPWVRCVYETVHGSLREGYAISVSATADNGASASVRYAFRQKLAENFLASPFIRRYFAEDAAILVSVFFGELLRSDLDVLGGTRSVPTSSPTRLRGKGRPRSSARR